MTRLFRIVLLAATMTAPFALAGCEDDDPCASEECDSEEGELSDEEEQPLPEQETPCRQACAALLGDCDATDPSYKVNQSACMQWCKEDGMTPAETSCLAGVTCGDPVDQCFAAE